MTLTAINTKRFFEKMSLYFVEQVAAVLVQALPVWNSKELVDQLPVFMMHISQEQYEYSCFRKTIF
jgi:hypothetical protein